MTELPERFWSKVDKTNSCWLWTASIRPDGYGEFSMKVGDVPNVRRTYTAHGLAYRDARGPVPAGMELDHLCRVRHCLNPDHLEPVTPAENTQRGMAPTTISKRTGLCFQGHRMTPENTYVKPKSGYRQCRICISVYNRTRRRRSAA